MLRQAQHDLNPQMQILEKERQNLWLWSAILFALGCVFFISFTQSFLENIVVFGLLFSATILLTFLNRTSNRALIYIASLIFLSGAFYTFLYHKIFLNHTEITGKVYVQGIGKVESVKKFHNQINHLDGLYLVISKPDLSRMEFNKKTTAKKSKKVELINKKDSLASDRRFLDYSKNYQQISWINQDGKERFPNPPEKIALTLAKADLEILPNDKIFFKAVFEPNDAREFATDFDFKLNAKSKKIGASGFVIGKIEILKREEISSLTEYFLQLRNKISDKIDSHLSGNNSAIAKALLIGEQKAIDKDFYEKIRTSGLAHLLSISGFHLSLAGAIFFFSSRFLLSRSEGLALNFDIKKIAAILALIATYFYLEISGSPIPAKRAFLMIALIFLAVVFHEKINSKRAIICAMLLLILYNPYVLFNIGFQLSFLAVLVLATFFDEVKYNISPKFLKYFCDIILLSFAIQIASLPFILHSFNQVSWLGFLSNIAAIPLTSFFIMPLGFLSLFLMPFSLEKYVLLAMNEGILLLIKVINFVSEIPYANLVSPHLSSIGLVISVVGLSLILFHKNHLRCYGIILLLLASSELKTTKRPDLIFEKEQKFFAIYDKENGLVFSKKLRDSKQRQSWLKHFGETEFKVGNFCQKEVCKFTQKNKKILVILKNTKTEKLCSEEFDLAVNLTKKYQLPNCLKAKQKIDNLDFYKEGTQEIFW